MLGLGIMLPEVNKLSAGFSPHELGDLDYYFDATNTTGWSVIFRKIRLVIDLL